MSGVGQYARLISLGGKIGLGEALVAGGLCSDEEQGRISPDDLADELSALGPTYVKLGQVLSTRPDLVPPAYLDALSRLQSDVPAEPFDEIQVVIERELGKPLDELFDRFDREPVAAASLGQVYRARTPAGLDVAVKVQRPGAREAALEDIGTLRRIAQMLIAVSSMARRYRLDTLVDELEATLEAELDYRREARDGATIARRLEGRDQIRAVWSLPEFSGETVLTTTWVDGDKVTEVDDERRAALDGPAICEQLFCAYLEMVLVDGVFHADPHPGNVLVDRNGRLVLLDYGMVGRIQPGLRRGLLQLLIAIGANQGQRAVQLAIEASRLGAGFDRALFEERVTQLVARDHAKLVGDLQIGRTLIDLCHIASECELLLPRELLLVGKTLMSLDQVAKSLAPEFDPHACVRSHVPHLASELALQQLDPLQLFDRALTIEQLASRLPRHVEQLVRRAADNEIELGLRGYDQAAMTGALRAVGNRTAAGMVIAALIVGAAMLMHVEHDFVLFGYPGLAMICFLGAAAAGVALLVEIYIGDRRRRASEATQR